MAKKKIYISPSNQNGNNYAYGNTTEDVQCGKIGEALKKALDRCGFETKLEQYLTATQRVNNSNAWGADMHIPIHTNAFNGQVGGTRIFYYSAGKDAAQCVFDELAPITPGMSESVSKQTTWIEIKNPKAVSVYCECEFHDVPAYAKWIIENTEKIGEAICKGVCKYYGVKYVEPKSEKPTATTIYRVQVGAFAEKANADLMLKRLAEAGFSGYITKA